MDNISSYTIIADDFKQSFSELSIPPGPIGLANHVFSQLVKSSFICKELSHVGEFLSTPEVINRIHTEIIGGDFYLYAGYEFGHVAPASNPGRAFVLKLSGVARVFVQSFSDRGTEGELMHLCRSGQEVICNDGLKIADKAFNLTLSFPKVGQEGPNQILIAGVFAEPMLRYDRQVHAGSYFVRDPARDYNHRQKAPTTK